MIDNLKSMAVFAIVVEEKSFRGAASRLTLSPSVISHHVSKLEQQVGAALIYRSTRAFSLTEEGKQLYLCATQMLSAANDGMSQFSQVGSPAITQLRVAIPEMLTSLPLFDRVTQFAEQHPGVQLNLSSSDITSNLIKDTLDVAIRIGRLKDSELKVRKIGEDKLIAVAAPALIKAHPRPAAPEDLRTWKHISFTPVPNDIEYKKSGTATRHIWGVTSAVTDSVQVMHKLARAGLGVAGLPYKLVHDDIKARSLQQLLPEWNGRTLDYFIVWHKNISARSVTRAFINHMCNQQ